MQFVVFAAFAIVLSLPSRAGRPTFWILVSDPLWIWAAVAGQVVLRSPGRRVTTRRVKTKLDHDPAWLPAAQRPSGQRAHGRSAPCWWPASPQHLR